MVEWTRWLPQMTAKILLQSLEGGHAPGLEYGAIWVLLRERGLQALQVLQALRSGSSAPTHGCH